MRIVIWASFKDEKALRKRCHSYLKVLISEISHRLPDNVNLFKKINDFSVSNTLKPQKEDIIVLLKNFNKTDKKISTIEIQWRKIHLIEWKEISNVAEFWCEVLDYKDSEEIIIFDLFHFRSKWRRR